MPCGVHDYPRSCCIVELADERTEGLLISRPIRILHVAKRFWPYRGGIERYVEDLGVEQSRRGSQVRVLTVDRDVVGGISGSLPTTESHRGLEIVRIPAVGSARVQLPVGGIRRIVASLRWADVIHHHDPRFLFEIAIVARLATGTPLLFHTHGLILHTPKYRRLKEFLLEHYYSRVLARGVDWVIADSEADRATLSGAARRHGLRITLVRNAIDLTEHLALADLTQENLIVCFGRLDRHKGLQALLVAVAQVPGPWELHVAGGGSHSLREGLQDLARRLKVDGRVHWLGDVPSETLHGLLSRAAVVAFPSEFEGFGLALLEGMASGRPVVANDIPTHREILGADAASCIVHFSDPQGAATALHRALTLSADQRAALTTRLRRRAATFDMRPMVDHIEAIYAHLGLPA